MTFWILKMIAYAQLEEVSKQEDDKGKVHKEIEEEKTNKNLF